MKKTVSFSVVLESEIFYACGETSEKKQFVFSEIAVSKENGLGLSVFAYMHKHMHFP